MLSHEKVHDAWALYKASFPPDYKNISSRPARNSVETLFKKDYEVVLNRGIDDYVKRNAPLDTKDLIEVGKAYVEIGEADLGLKSLQEAVRREPRSIVARFALGEALTRLKRFREAFNQARSLQRMASRDLRGSLLTALTHYHSGAHKLSVEWYHRAKLIEPQSPFLKKYNIPLWIETLSNK